MGASNVVDNRIIGLEQAQERLDAQIDIRKLSGPIADEAMNGMRSEMRNLGFFLSGETDASFKRRFRTKAGYLEGISIVAQRNAFILAHTGRDFRWSSVAGRTEIIKGSNPQDFIFHHIDKASERVGDVVAEVSADLAVKRLFPTK